MPNRRELLLGAAAGVLTAATARSDNAVHEAAGHLRQYKIPHTDLVVSRICYGGSANGIDPRSPSFLDDAVSMLNFAYDQGINFFDTANFYQDGRSEEALGEMLRRSPGLKRRVVIQSKCSFREPKSPVLGDAFAWDLSRENIMSSTEGSLRRLGVEVLDILLLHCPDPLAEPEEIAAAFDTLKRSGKVRYFGVSNYNGTQIDLLQRSLHQPLVANQFQLGVGHCIPIANTSMRSVGPGALVDYCRLHDIQVQAYSPLALTDSQNLLRLHGDTPAEVREAVALLNTLAKDKNVGLDGIALAWLLRHPAKIVPVIGASKPEHIKLNCAADHVQLTRDEWDAIFRAAMKIQGLDVI